MHVRVRVCVRCATRRHTRRYHLGLGHHRYHRWNGRARLPVLALALALASVALLGAPPALPGGEALAERLSVLDNGILRIGMDLNRGGAVTLLEARDHPGNLINSYDYGRQIQMSVYAGPVPFTPNGKQPRPEWRGLGWNPIQTGDCNGRPSQVVESRNDGAELYLRLIPMQWPLDNEPGDCSFETWTRLEGACVHMRFRVTNHRADRGWYPARTQELPAVYTIAALHRLFSYTGEHPFSGEALSELHNDWTRPWPWTRWLATEGWSALVGDDDWGIGVVRDEGCAFNGGLYGAAGSRDVHGVPTGYLAPVEVETLDHDIVYDHGCTLVVGQLAAIRARCSELAVALKQLPSWRFAGATRQHWHVEGARDGGLPQTGGWRILLDQGTPRLVGPSRCWAATAAPQLTITLTWSGAPSQGRLFWRRSDADALAAGRSVALALVADSQPHTYRIDLAGAAEYHGLIAGLAIDPIGEAHPGAELVVHDITLGAAGR
jgi:hypothetical protein